MLLVVVRTFLLELVFLPSLALASTLSIRDSYLIRETNTTRCMEATISQIGWDDIFTYRCRERLLSLQWQLEEVQLSEDVQDHQPHDELTKVYHIRSLKTKMCLAVKEDGEATVAVQKPCSESASETFWILKAVGNGITNSSAFTGTPIDIISYNNRKFLYVYHSEFPLGSQLSLGPSDWFSPGMWTLDIVPAPVAKPDNLTAMRHAYQLIPKEINYSCMEAIPQKVFGDTTDVFPSRCRDSTIARGMAWDFIQVTGFGTNASQPAIPGFHIKNLQTMMCLSIRNFNPYEAEVVQVSCNETQPDSVFTFNALNGSRVEPGQVDEFVIMNIQLGKFLEVNDMRPPLGRPIAIEDCFPSRFPPLWTTKLVSAELEELDPLGHDTHETNTTFDVVFKLIVMLIVGITAAAFVIIFKKCWNRYVSRKQGSTDIQHYPL